MDEIDIHAKLAQIETAPHFSMIFDGDTERAELIADHLIWLHSIRRETVFSGPPHIYRTTGVIQEQSGSPYGEPLFCTSKLCIHFTPPSIQ